ncbi:hypothetical protein [[Mycoplasma] gypis]|uniref:Uncharacterized protein n=1 Tax=[Mycoplasma] gypis TaxID=92404 RepID=A0ABZ2RS29_9BACT|nr:hypothetical protein [[Mycoplasma] gypis]MBN0919607.1 hypothetical protein [[Mycoplasma] gypis]
MEKTLLDLKTKLKNWTIGYIIFFVVVFITTIIGYSVIIANFVNGVDKIEVSNEGASYNFKDSTPKAVISFTSFISAIIIISFILSIVFVVFISKTLNEINKQLEKEQMILMSSGDQTNFFLFSSIDEASKKASYTKILFILGLFIGIVWIVAIVFSFQTMKQIEKFWLIKNSINKTNTPNDFPSMEI